MPIILQSNGLYTPEAQKRLIQLFEETNSERKAVIVTAADPIYGTASGHAARTQEMLASLNFSVDSLDVRVEGANRLAEYPLIYLNGEDPFALFAGLRDSGAGRILEELYRKGHLIIGQSAGATVLGTTIEHATLLDSENANTVSADVDLNGLGLVRAVVLPHSNRYEDREAKIKLLDFISERPERLLKIEDDRFYVYEIPTREQLLNPEFVLGKLEDAGLAKYRPDIAKLLWPSLKIELRSAAESELAIGTSRVGGGTDLPEGTNWPEWEECPYTFIAQINLAELPEGHKLPLPESGLLSFFYASAAMYGDHAFHGDPTTCRVIYTPVSSLAELRTLPVPRSLLEVDPGVVLSVAKMSFTSELCVPESESAYLESLGLGWDGDHLEYEKYWNTFRGSLGNGSSPLHRLLGHPDQLQGDMQVHCAEMIERSSFDASMNEEEKARFRREALEWRLLLQIDSDEVASIDWVGTGRIYFWIREKDLQRQIFDHVICIMQNT